MKALIKKELRENLKLAVLGVAVFIFLLLQTYRNYGAMLRPLVAGGTEVHGAYLQPLANEEILWYVGGFCAVFGLLLGWLQGYYERRNDLWSFLAHRPLTRSQLFLGKIIAGLGLYVLVAGLPLLGFTAWAVTPGDVAAPFEWSMLLPIIALFLGGPVYYLAGMLAGLRQARWYGSRGLGVGAAVLASLALVSLPSFGMAILFVAMVAGVLAVALWGAFHSNGFYQGQPGAGKTALALSLALGAVLVAFVAGAFVEVVLPRWSGRSGSWSYYVTTKDGTIYKVTQAAERPATVVDLQGAPMRDPKTGRAADPQDLGRLTARTYSLRVNFGDHPFRARPYFQGGQFSYFRTTPYTLWFYWPRYGRLVAFDVRTRRPTGSLGPDGFSPGLALSGARFFYPPGEYLQSSALKTTNAVYRVDLESRTATLLFAAPAGERLGALVDLSRQDYDWTYTALATSSSIYLLKPDGQTEWQAPYTPSYPAYDYIRISFLGETNRFALWLEPSAPAARKASGRLPLHVSWFTSGSLVNTADVPSAEPASPRYNLQDRVIALLAAPVSVCLLPVLFQESWPDHLVWEFLWGSLATAAVVCVPVGWWLTRRYRFSPGAQLGWAVFHLATGVPGLLAFLSVQEWPARTPCPKCGKLRVVPRETCEHCAAPWPPPQPSGIEIFEPVK